ncbi:prenyltransferase/squalene oxidase repeat-containing protein [Gimesia panareensis]|uniref:Pectic acid lyase n=1 Tax=Gimesia panareensis TaxID=2527978 RepID=A0A518FP37_9PLAN|nr:prenyltransferase/squalene oxidase repeat-containing protein [Gimesia panareensis]QDT25833.1 Pectic acid lyase [Gimesia panareensis]QDU48772.1 Pectic acid lyase [Gimesia panareensis]QDV18060.1 Pectic acid lyase [Gimesia panareensis]
MSRRLITSTLGLLLLLSPALCRAQELDAQKKRVDDSIQQAVQFLSKSQQPSGAWSFNSYGESTAATSLAIMAFMAAGYVPEEGPYGDQINRGIDWVLAHQADNGLVVHHKSHGPMYSHGISTLMLAEVAGMLKGEREKKCREVLERAIKLIIAAQNVPKDKRNAGGWRYNQTSKDSDLSVTGWQLLALRAAKNIGCDISADQIDKAVAYVRHCRGRNNVGFAYQPGGAPSATRTGTGILALEICGQHHTKDALEAGDYLVQRPLHPDEFYYFYGAYYCSVGMFQMGGEYWRKTRDAIVPQLLEMQKHDGSWLATKGSEKEAGKVYATSLAVLALAVEYQYLPIYQR